jgi:hypothetical protein
MGCMGDRHTLIPMGVKNVGASASLVKRELCGALST